MMQRIAPALILFVVLHNLSCSDKDRQPFKPAFYYWQTRLSLGADQADYLKQCGVTRLYVKILDIAYDPDAASPTVLSRLLVSDTIAGLKAFELTPVVYLTNEVFRNISEDQMQRMAAEILKVQALLAPLGAVPASPELQIDCDWTPGTRQAFFRFLEILKTLTPAHTRLSATIRLHQYKFPENTGVPPVARGMLMCYNTGDIDNPRAGNSILDIEDARKYLRGGSGRYPLPLDLALPVFSWTLVYRGGELWKILPGAQPGLEDGILQTGTFRSGHYLRPGDYLRREEISPELLKAVMPLAAGAGLADDAHLVFFQLDSVTPQVYPASTILQLCQLADSIRAN